MRVRNDKTIFVCSSCSKSVFRLGSRVNQDKKLCGSCNTSGLVIPNAPKETPQIVTELVQDKTLSLTPINTTVQGKINYYQKKLNKVQELSVIHTDKSFDELWTLAERQLNPQQ
jgi:hypothetical protein